ncbi:MAG: VWA domain-containing protein [Phycisphaerales bacterium]
MSFLAPTSAIVAAAIVFPLLGVLYLLKLRRRPVRVSSIMLWPASATDVQVNVPLAPPRPSFLLLLHLLIAAALVMAVGRPVLLDSGDRAARTIVLIDRSASMSAMDGASPGGERVSRLAEATRRARELVSKAPDGSAFGVVSIAADAQIVQELTADRAAVLAAIDGVTPTDQPGDLAPAMEVARAILAASGQEAESESGAEVLVFSDGSFAGTSRELRSPGATVRLVRCGPGADADKVNLGVVVLSARRDADDAGLVHLFAKVENASREARAVPLRFAVDGAVVETRSIEVPGSAAEAPGESGLVFSAKVPAGGLATVTLLVDDQRDLLASDNTAATRLLPDVPLKMLLVRQGATARAADAPVGAGFLLSDALEELRPAEFRTVPTEMYETMKRAGELRFFDLVVFDGVSPREAPPIPSLSFGAGVPGIELGGPDSGEEAKPVQSWVRSNVLLRDITLDGVVAARVPSLRGDDKSVQVIARGERSPLIMQSRAADGPRRVVVAFALENSNWPLQPGFPIFLKAASDWLTARGADAASVQFLTTQAASVEGSGAFPVFEGPLTIRPREQVLASGQRRLALGVIDRAGVYTPNPAGTFPPVAVNLLDAHESAVATSDTLRVGSRTISAPGGASRPREIWPWLILLAAGLLALEWIFFARSARL